jgi:hypothetical protein
MAPITADRHGNAQCDKFLGLAVECAMGGGSTGHCGKILHHIGRAKANFLDGT